MSYFIYTDLIGSLLDPKHVDPESILINVGAYLRSSKLLMHTTHKPKQTTNQISNCRS